VIAPAPFEVAILDAILDDLKTRLANTRWPDEQDQAGWDYGANLNYMKELVEYWKDGFDWHAAEGKINAFPPFTAPITAETARPWTSILSTRQAVARTHSPLADA